MIKRRVKSAILEHLMGIEKDERVLDVGSGHNPHPRADILVDKYVSDDKERGGAIIRDRTFYQADIVDLPFEDNEFDYVITRHVIEYVDNLERALTELQRVGKRGYIESPSVFLELLHPNRDYHKWLVLDVGGKLLFKEKPKKLGTELFGDLFEEKGPSSRSIFLKGFLKQYERLLRVNYFWNGEINYEINPQGKYRDYFEEPYEGEKVRKLIENRKAPMYEVLPKILYEVLVDEKT